MNRIRVSSSRSDGAGEFGKRGLDTAMDARIGAEFVVAASNVLHERVTADDHPRRMVAFKSPHGTESGFESAVVAFDAVVRVLGAVVERGRDETFDRRSQRRGPVGDDLDWLTMRAECRREESSSGSEIPSGRDEHVDDLTVLINCSVHIPPRTGDLHVRLVHEPTVTDRMAAWSGRVREKWGETLHPPVDRDVIDLDATFTEQFFDVAVGEPVPQVPPYGEDDDLRREPKPDEGRARNYGDQTEMTRPHHATLTAGRDLAPMQQSPPNSS